MLATCHWASDRCDVMHSSINFLATNANRVLVKLFNFEFKCLVFACILEYQSYTGCSFCRVEQHSTELRFHSILHDASNSYVCNTCETT